MVLEVFGKIRRKGQLYLVLVLPDGSRSHFPAAWTDSPDAPAAFEASALEPPIASALGLWRLRQQVDALLRRTQQGQDEGTTTPNVVGGTASDSANLSGTDP
jgi:hypothetical protein